ncbi:MAG: hypothetical protein K0S02_1641 [Achromobacter mucicolens]|jgi:hypothetical protein|uniref:hypothetical protein n=1 Tax=Achromobacter mucicolens TaxID=1389922 RepID=UPI00242E4C3C|nr:hypothetical protein [Achromobacter mucicolens]MDF2861369.1 hypothetical protein [Achromobacter mucicolens]
MNFDTDEEINQWISDHSLEDFRHHTEHGVFAGRRLGNARAFLRRLDAREASAREQRLFELAEDATEASMQQAKTAKDTLRVAKIALWISVGAVVVTVVGWFISK